MSNPAYEQVLSILHDSRGWPADCAPAPEATALALETRTPDEVAEALESWLDAKSAGRPAPPNYPGTFREYLRYSYFSNGTEYWEENTQIALGFIALPIVSQDRVARTVDEWRENQSKGISYLGFRLYDPDNPMSVAEWENRLAAAARYDRHSAPWYDAGMGETYRVLTTEGLFKKWVAASFVKPAEYLDGNIETFYGSALQQVLDNLHAARRMGNVRAKWLADQRWAKNPAWTD